MIHVACAVRRVRQRVTKAVGVTAAALLVFACCAGAQELFDRSYDKYIPLDIGLSCRMDEFAENHGAVGYRGVLKNESNITYLDVVVIVCGYDSSGKFLAATDLPVGRVAKNDVTRFEGTIGASYWVFAKFGLELKKAVPADSD